MKNILNKKIGGILGILAIAAISLGCLGGEDAIKKDTYKVEAPDWEVGDYFIYAEDSWDSNSAGYAEIWSITDEKEVNDTDCWELQVITSDGYNYTAYISKDKFSIIRYYRSHYNSSYVEMYDYSAYSEDGYLLIVEEKIGVSGYELAYDYYWKMDEGTYGYYINSVRQYEEYYFEYNRLSIKNDYISYSSIREKKTLEWGNFDILKISNSRASFWYNNEFGFYEGQSPITQYWGKDWSSDGLILIKKGNNKDILNDTNSDHIPDALAKANVDILYVDTGIPDGLSYSATDWSIADPDVPDISIQNDSGVAKIVNTTIYAYRGIESGQMNVPVTYNTYNYNIPNKNGNVSVYIYKDKDDIFTTDSSGMPNWVLVAKAENISVMWNDHDGSVGNASLDDITLTSTLSGLSGVSWVGFPDNDFKVVIKVNGDFRGDSSEIYSGAADVEYDSEDDDCISFWGFN